MQFNGAQPIAANSALDVAYPTTFYPNAINSDDAIPVPIRGGERIEANMTLNAQHAMRLQLPFASSRDGGFGAIVWGFFLRQDTGDRWDKGFGGRGWRFFR